MLYSTPEMIEARHKAGLQSSVDTIERCGNSRQRAEQLVSAWSQGIRADAESAGKADDALIEAPTTPKKRPRALLTDEEVDTLRR